LDLRQAVVCINQATLFTSQNGTFSPFGIATFLDSLAMNRL